MTNRLRTLPVYALVASLALSACSVTAQRPGSVVVQRDTDRTERRDERYDPRMGRDDDRRDRRDRDDDRDDDRRGRHDGRDRDRDRDRDDDRKDRKDRRHDRDDDRRSEANVQINIGGYFGERQRNDVYTYYGKSKDKGKCPPGLAKKGNGCQPPGQAKKWKLGQSLPRDVVYQPVEADIRIQLGTPPVGYEFVRVANDVLMIAVGTAMVMDAIEDLSGGR